jgi:hypothetical protein
VVGPELLVGLPDQLGLEVGHPTQQHELELTPREASHPRSVRAVGGATAPSPPDDGSLSLL